MSCRSFSLLPGARSGGQVVSRHQQRYLDATPWSLQTSYYPMTLVERGAFRLLQAVDIAEGTVAYLAPQYRYEHYDPADGDEARRRPRPSFPGALGTAARAAGAVATSKPHTSTDSSTAATTASEQDAGDQCAHGPLAGNFGEVMSTVCSERGGGGAGGGDAAVRHAGAGW